MLRVIAEDHFAPVLSLGELKIPGFPCRRPIWLVLAQDRADSDQVGAAVSALPCSKSLCWTTSQLQELSKMRNVYKMTFDFCAFGTKWRKRTTVLAGHVDSADVWALDTMRCRGHERRSFTGKNHVQLVGYDSSHQCSRTHRSRMYPVKLANRLATPSPPECREHAMIWACNGRDDTPCCAGSSLRSLICGTRAALLSRRRDPAKA